MFIGRESEIETLNQLYNENKFQMVVIYGRRRIGKTTLITEFIKDKPSIFFTAQEVNDKMNLERFSQKVYSFFNVPGNIGYFKSWNDAFTYIVQMAKEKRFILAIDEFPYAVSANNALKSILQTAIDHEFCKTGIYLILCGSQVAFMENEVLGYKSPLFGRRTAQIRLEGFDYFDAGKMLNSFSTKDKVKFYACFGGTPLYLAQIKHSESFEKNVKRLFFDIAGYLYNEPMMLLQQELREPAMYNSIISAIASGATRLNEISTKIEEDSPKVSKYLQTLINLQIIRKEYPFGENRQTSRKGIYKIADPVYLFWYSFVFSNRPEIESGNGDIIADEEVFGDRLSTYIGKPPFELICLQYLYRKNRQKALPFTATSFGSWWGTDPVEKSQSDFDVIAANRSRKQILLGECKWRNAVNIKAELKRLMMKDHLLSEYKERYYWLFIKNKVSESVIGAYGDRVKVVCADMLYG